MPNRILKDSICRSDSIDSLTWFEEVLFYRLIVSCDDYGRFDGRIAIIKGTCFPLKDIRNGDIEKALEKLSAVGMVEMYEVQGRPYLQLIAWERHQQIRAKKSRYPAPDSTCNQLISNVPEIQSNPNQNTNRDIPPISPLTHFEEFLEVYPIHPTNVIPAQVEYCRLLVKDCYLTEQDLVEAARHYAEAMSILGRNERYIKRPENFLKDNFFVDYLPGHYKRPEPKRKYDANKGMECSNYGDMSQLEKELLANG